MDQQAQSAARRATAVLVAASVGTALCSGTISVMANQIIDTFALVGAQQGLMASAISAGSFIAMLSLPLLQGRVAKLTLLALGMLAQAAALALIGLSPFFALLLAFCLALGVSTGWASTTCNILMVDIHKKNSARHLGMLHGSYAAGSIAAPLILQGLLFLMAWRGVYLVLAALVLALAVANVLGLRSCRGGFGGGTFREPRLGLAQVRRFFGDRVSVLAVLCILFYGGSQIGLTSWLVRYMAVRFGDAALGSLGVSLYWVATTFSRFFAPRLRVGPVKLVIAGTAVTGVAHAAAVLSGSAAAMVAAAAFTGLASGFVTPMLISVSVSRHPGATSFATTIAMLALRGSQLIMPLLLGLAAANMALSMLLVAASALLATAAGAATLWAERRAPAADV